VQLAEAVVEPRELLAGDVAVGARRAADRRSSARAFSSRPVISYHRASRAAMDGLSASDATAAKWRAALV
jgi:hypothetical protein